MKTFKVDYKTLTEIEGEEKLIKREIIVQAESLSDIEYVVLPALQAQTKFPENIEITSVKLANYERFVINDMISVDELSFNEHKKEDETRHIELFPYQEQDQFDQNTFFFEATVEIFEMDRKGKMKKTSSPKLLIPADKVKLASEICMTYMKPNVCDWKIKDIKTTNIYSVILVEEDYNKSLEYKKIIENL